MKGLALDLDADAPHSVHTCAFCFMLIGFNLQESQLVLSDCCVYFDAAVTDRGLGFSSTEYYFPNKKRSRRL